MESRAEDCEWAEAAQKSSKAEEKKSIRDGLRLLESTIGGTESPRAAGYEWSVKPAAPWSVIRSTILLRETLQNKCSAKRSKS